ncbi:MAG: exodeoxyribonuclease VII large subunit [Alphaproteobacteria bacterium]|nr:exodeoxyribonuclease VII large subunit [Alphaproteobacteria bacterium]
MTNKIEKLPTFSVSELSSALKKTVESSFSFVRVRGEISGFKQASSGHMYLALKDESAVIDAICWRGMAGKLSVKPEDGLEVICTGRLTTYPNRSKYQIIIESMEFAGEGALLKMLEDRRKKLAAEGLFDISRKKKIPFLPDVIGVVTSPTGAVFKDILHRLFDRFPRRVILYPVLVQGEKAAEQIAEAVKHFNNFPINDIPKPDVLIVARGGGSLEDLWAFNEEIVVRAVADSKIPVISAVGHETDTTLVDYASDLRAPTPTGAAEKAVPVRIELLAHVSSRDSRLINGIRRLFDENQIRLTGMSRGIPNLERLIGNSSQRLDDWTERLENTFPNYVERKETDIKQLAELLESYSFKKILNRGFSLVKDTKGNPVTTASKAVTGDKWQVEFKDGAVNVLVNDGKHAPKKQAKRNKKTDERQGSLF